jgi:hypothetical protein
MNKLHLSKLFKDFEFSQDKSGRAFFDYYKSISNLNIALIGLLIGLKASPIPNYNAKLAFFISIIFIGLSILFSLATRFYEVASCKGEVEIRRIQILNYVEDPNKNDLQISNLGKYSFYRFTEIATLTTLILSILSLMSYVYFLEF